MNFGLVFPFEQISTSDMEVFPFFLVNKVLTEFRRIQIYRSHMEITACILNIRSSMKLSRKYMVNVCIVQMLTLLLSVYQEIEKSKKQKLSSNYSYAAS